MDFTRLECRDILANVNKVNVDPDVLAKLMIGANTTALAAPSTVLPTWQQPAGRESFGDVPEFVPVVLTAAQLARIQVPDGDGTRPATQADVDEVNRIKQEAHNREWRLRATYRANLNERDVVNAAFDAPERERGFNPQFERVPIGGKNAHGDECVRVDTDGESIFRCAQGHGYKQSRSLRSCSACFLAGVASEAPSDPNALVGSDSRW